MKKTSTLILLLCLFLSVSAQKKKIGYFTSNKSMDAPAATVQNDPVLLMLQADPNLDVTPNFFKPKRLSGISIFAEPPRPS
jgi:hypothetical protein